MNLYITQNSYYFVHKNFMNFFLENNSFVIFVQEKERGRAKQLLEILSNFGIFNFLRIIFLEILFFIILYRKTLKLNSIYLSDMNFNEELSKILSNKKFKEIISIGCPCKIDHSFQVKFRISILNLHGGILPFQKGRFSPLKAIKNADKYLGASIHEISQSFDEGKILSQKSFLIKNKKKLFNYNKVLKLSNYILESYLRKERHSISNEVLKKFNKL